MIQNPRIQQLLDELAITQATPEEVCRLCPELLPEVRVFWREMRRVEAQLDQLFPTPPADDITRPAFQQEGAPLPHIPGYEMEALLGHGGMGVVFRARQLRLNRVVALKMAIAGEYATPHERGRFQREAEAVAGLRHPNIVQIHDVGDSDGRPYFTMEFVEGGSLAQKLSGTPQPGRQAATLVATLAGAVQAAHQSGIIHRDLKPANILLTSTGIPKITDFGLARRLEGEAGLTRTGTAVGTPSYMAPEQARGKAESMGPAVDVYALGAILYESLTGRPPFRAETSAETVLQVISQDPVPPFRLNGKVPRDLETICLKCLQKDAWQRYVSAAALADDLDRFLRGEAIAARPEGRLAHLGKWIKRHPTHSTMLAVSLSLLVAFVGGIAWLAIQQAERRHVVEADLNQVAELQKQARWQEARATLERAEARLDGGGSDELVRRLSEARRDLDLVIQLDSIRLKRVTLGQLTSYQAQAAHKYQEAFRDVGIGSIYDQPERVAAKVNASAVRHALVAALDDWSTCATKQEERSWLLEVTNKADPDPEGWRRKVSAVWENSRALGELAQLMPVEGLSVSLLLAIGERLKLFEEKAAPFLKRVQKAYPADFWANLILGDAIFQLEPVDAVGYYRAALASRPGEAVGYCVVGDALRFQKNLDGAIDYYKKALQLDPNYARTNNNLGLALQALNRLDEAIDLHKKALQIDPDYLWGHYDLGNALRSKGLFQEAYNHYQQVIRLDPTIWEVQEPLRSAMFRLGREPDAAKDWRKAIDANPRLHTAWFGYAEFCLFLGQREEYVRARQSMLDLFGDTTNQFVAEPISRACLLLPATEEVVRQCTILADRALATKGTTQPWIYRYFLFAKGLAQYRQGQFRSAIATLEGEASKVMGPAPRLIIAMAQHGLGEKQQARKSLAAAVLAFDWGAAVADRRDVWICHILRREAEAMILPNLQSFLQAKYQPCDCDERAAFVGTCQFQGLHGTATRLYAEAFAAEPRLTEDLIAQCVQRATRRSDPPSNLDDLSSECRYPIIRSAAMAGCGLGKDSAMLSETERMHCRKQARDWLRADLTVWVRMLDSDSQGSRNLAKKILMSWQNNTDLAGIREPSALNNFSLDERKDWQALWAEVANALKR